MASRFNGPMANAPVIRGLTGERVLVLQDGDRAGDLSSAAADHLNAVDPSSAERIEVIRGPASLLYGNNALGGVVNVISSDIPTSIPVRRRRATGWGRVSRCRRAVWSASVSRLPFGKQSRVTARGGCRHFERPARRWRRDAAEHQRQHQQLPRSAAASSATTRRLAWCIARWISRTGLPHPEDEEAIRLDGDRRMVQLQSTIGTHYAPIAQCKVDGTAQWYAHSEIEPSARSARSSRSRRRRRTSRRGRNSGVASGAFGLQGLFRQYTPDGRGSVHAAGATTTTWLSSLYQECRSRGAVEEQYAALQLGARYDRFSIDDRAGRRRSSRPLRRGAVAELRQPRRVARLSLPVATALSLTANASRGFRAPTVEEMFANGFHAAVGTFDIGNPDLDAGTEHWASRPACGRRRRATFAQVSTYYNTIDKYIRPVAVGTQDVDGTDVPLVNLRASRRRAVRR